MNTDRPSLAFDRVFIPQHCYRHICGNGVGLMQIMDYYNALRTVLLTMAVFLEAIKRIDEK